MVLGGLSAVFQASTGAHWIKLQPVQQQYTQRWTC